MILFPSETVVRPRDVEDRVRKELRLNVCETARGRQNADDCVDVASQGSFPASDAPPWTLGQGGQPIQEP